MKLNQSLILTLLSCLLLLSCSRDDAGGSREITEELLRDKITGGIIGQFFDNLNGRVHENKYTDEPGNVKTHTPGLSDGAFTDDDTDIEFVYIYHMNKTGKLMLPYEEIYRLWKENLNDQIRCSNRYAGI